MTEIIDTQERVTELPEVVNRALPVAPMAAGARVFLAKQHAREALSLLPKNNASSDGVRRAEQLLRQAADELAAETTSRALASAQKAQGYDPDAYVQDAIGRRRSPAATPGYHAGRRPGNAGKKYPPNPPTVTEIKALLDACADDIFGLRMQALILIIWRAGLRISEALSLHETDLRPDVGEIYIRKGKGGKSGTVGVDDWVWPLLAPWMDARREYPAGPLFCGLLGPRAGTVSWSASGVRESMRKLAARAGVRRRIAPHQFRHAMSVELLTEEKSLIVLQRQLRHSNLAVTTAYTQAFPQRNVINTMRGRDMPTLPAFGAPVA